MNVLQRIKKAFRSSLATPERWLVDYFSGGGIETSAGVRVTSSTAMYFVAVFACINILSRTVGSLPLYLYRRLPGGGKEKARNHPLFNLIRYLPNPEMTAMRYRSTLQGHLASWGNAYSYIDWSGNGYPAAIWPLRPDRVQVRRLDGRLDYYYYPSTDDVKLGIPSQIPIPPGYMLHIPGFGYDGIIGYSPITLAREAIGLGLAADEFGARYFGQGTHPGIIIEHPNKLKDPKALRDALHETYAGLGKSHRMMLLEEGMKANKIVIDPKDSQFLETRKFQITEIARLFLVPPHMIADLDRATFSNIEEQSIEFVVHTMRPWFVLWEEEYMRMLLRADEREEYFFQFDVDALMRGDIGKRYAAYAQGKQWGWLSTNDIRDKENLNPVDGGDLYMVPLNMIPAQDAGKVPATPPNPPPNRQIYRSRLENAFRNIFVDAAGRVIRKETKAIRQSLKKHQNGDFEAFLAEFYREMPDYVQKQMNPAFLGFSEAIIGMESELNGLKYDDFKAGFERFISDYATSFGKNYVETSLIALRTADKNGNIETVLTEWEGKRAEKMASEQTEFLADEVGRQIGGHYGSQT